MFSKNALFAAFAALVAIAGPASARDDREFVPQPEPRPRFASLANPSAPARQQPAMTRTIVADPTGREAGTITVITKTRELFFSLGDGKAIRYGVGVGRAGFSWNGTARVGRMAEWPDWTPPAAMLKRRPDLPRHMAGGIENPLGARAMYLYSGGRDMMFRIHGTNEPWSIGHAVSSGCIRMMNADVEDLYSRVKVGARVIVL